MNKRKKIWDLCFLVVILVICFVLIPISPAGRYQTLYAEDISQPTEETIIFDSVNNIRDAYGIKNLCSNEVLFQIADIRAKDMIDRHYFSHYTPEGTTVVNIIKNWGIEAKYRGENLAEICPPEFATLENVINAWMGSEGHRNNILRNAYRQIGVSICNDGNRKIIVLVFTS
jgi:uncharacterized protein YkwD